MGSPAAFRELTTLLVDLLRVRLAAGEDDGVVETHQIQPLPPTAIDDDSNVRLGLYLHDVSTHSGRASESAEIDDEYKVRPPLALDARYLLTAFPNASAENEASGIHDQHEVLGRAMQALYDNNVIEPETLPDSLGDHELTITHEDRDQRSILDLWGTFPDVPKQPCACYRVGPVLIDSTQKTAFERVSERAVRVSRGSERADDEQ